MEYANRRRKTKREAFLDSMNAIIPWSQWIELIRPYYYNKKRGRCPIDIEILLRMYLMQNWFNLSDEGMEEAIYDSYAMRSFLGINFIDEQAPDATTLNRAATAWAAWKLVGESRTNWARSSRCDAGSVNMAPFNQPPSLPPPSELIESAQHLDGHWGTFASLDQRPR